ncbi:MAG: metalloregulator ArsR/SmtB family transcription factor [Luteolibacter sp.]
MTTDIVVFFKALADETRWRIACLAADEALCVCELADILDMPQSSVSSHVQIIRKAGLLESEQCGKWTYFRIEPKTRALLKTIRETVSPKSSAILSQDARRAVARLKERESSCCPRPQHLAISPTKKPLSKP